MFRAGNMTLSKILFASLTLYHQFIASWHHERVEKGKIAYVRGGNKIIESKKTGNHKKVMEKTQETNKKERNDSPSG
jgi:hypothetical protein